MSTTTTTNTKIDLHTIKVDLEPMMPMKNEIEFNKVTLFIGANGTGKSVLLKSAFALSYIGNTYSIAKLKGMNILDHELREVAEFAFTKTFDDFDSSGECYATYTNGAKVTVKFTLGKCTFAEVILMEDGIIPSVVYAPSSMRLFSQYENYLKVRKLISSNLSLNEQELFKMLENFKLYEVTLGETLIAKSPIDVSSLTALYEDPYNIKPINYIEVDLEKSQVLARYSDNTTSRLSTLSAGEQSALNIFMMSNNF